MNRSDINALLRAAAGCFQTHGWVLPPKPRWDVTDFGLGDWRKFGLVLVNLAEEPEYCEKLMYAQKGMTTPAHCHRRKKEDIICRWGALAMRLWADEKFSVNVNGEARELSSSGATLELPAGWRVTLVPGVYHEFFPASDECIIGEVSTANDDLRDNFFVNPDIGRYPQVHEDEPALLRLLSDPSEP